jgi:hypothetical protein
MNRKFHACRKCGGKGKSTEYLDAPCERCGGYGGDVPMPRRGTVCGWFRFFDANGRHWEAVTKPSSRNRVAKELGLLVMANHDGGVCILPVGVEPDVRSKANRA